MGGALITMLLSMQFLQNKNKSYKHWSLWKWPPSKVSKNSTKIICAGGIASYIWVIFTWKAIKSLWKGFILAWAVILAVAAAAATAAAGGSPPGVVGVSKGMGGVTALPTRKYWPPRSKRFIEDTASRADWGFSYSVGEYTQLLVAENHWQKGTREREPPKLTDEAKAPVSPWGGVSG